MFQLMEGLMNYTDEILNKIKEEKIKKIDDLVFRYMLIKTRTYEEVSFIVDKLKFMNIKFSKDMLQFYLMFIDEFIESYNILKEILKYKKININIFTLVLETADNDEQISKLLTEMQRNGIKKFTRFNMILMTKQKSYKAARMILEKDILTEEYYINRLYEVNNDPIKEIFSILFVKAQEEDEIKQIKDELQSVGMSIDIKDYQKYLLKYSKIRTMSIREKAYELEELCLERVEKFLNIKNERRDVRSAKSNVSSRTSKRISNVYFRDKSMSDDIKLLYNNCCQICGSPLDVGNGYYSETHHIHPLYLNGPDNPENMVNLCPNHHVLFDRGAITIDLAKKSIIHVNGAKEELKILKHEINQAYIDFHNKNIFSQRHIYRAFSSLDNNTVTYGSKVTIQNSITKEENLIFIEDNNNDITYFNYHLLGHAVGDYTYIEDISYIILNVVP